VFLLKGLIKGDKRLNQLSKILIERLKANSNNYEVVVSILVFLILFIVLYKSLKGPRRNA
jgi:hypothetical protein